MKKRTAGIATATLMGGLALAGAGLTAATANAEPGHSGPMPTYHWCPGDYWDAGWGYNWEGGFCHNEHHRDIDGADYSRDWWGGPPDQWAPPPPPPPWAPPPWAPWAPPPWAQ